MVVAAVVLAPAHLVMLGPIPYLARLHLLEVGLELSLVLAVLAALVVVVVTVVLVAQEILLPQAHPKVTMVVAVATSMAVVVVVLVQ